MRKWALYWFESSTVKETRAHSFAYMWTHSVLTVKCNSKLLYFYWLNDCIFKDLLVAHHKNSVLSELSFSLFDAVHSIIFSMHCLTFVRNEAVWDGKQLPYSCVSSAYSWPDRPLACMTFNSSDVYIRNSKGLRTEPCGTPHWTARTVYKSERHLTTSDYPVR